MLNCGRSTDHKPEPIHFIFGMGVSYGKISTPIDFGGASPIMGLLRGKTCVLGSWACVRSIDLKSEPIHSIFGINVYFGKI